MSDTIMRIEANVIRVVKSPMSPKVKIVELSCGHALHAAADAAEES